VSAAILMKTFIPIIAIILTILSCNNGQDIKIKQDDSLRDISTKGNPSMLSISIIAIKGNQLDKANEIFNALSYADLRHDRRFTSLDSCMEFLDENYFDYTKKNTAIRGLWVNNGWTIILDPEMVDATNDTAIETLSEKLNTEVLTFLIQSTSGSFSFAKYNPIRQRYFFVTDGQMTKDSGTPLLEEKGLNINKNIFSDDILNLAGKFGINTKAENVDTFVVKELQYKE
jgi:hypothetical protein